MEICCTINIKASFSTSNYLELQSVILQQLNYSLESRYIAINILKKLILYKIEMNEENKMALLEIKRALEIYFHPARQNVPMNYLILMTKICAICNLQKQLQNYLQLLGKYVSNIEFNRETLYEKIGNILFDSENYKEALPYLQKAESCLDLNTYERSQSLACNCYYLTCCYVYFFRVEDARAQIRKFLRIKVRSDYQIVNFATLLVSVLPEDNQHEEIFKVLIEEAIQKIDKLKINNRNLYIHYFYEIGKNFYAIGRYSLGIECFMKCLSVASEDEIADKCPILFPELAGAFYMLNNEKDFSYYYQLTLKCYQKNKRLLWKDGDYIGSLIINFYRINKFALMIELVDDVFVLGLGISKRIKLVIIEWVFTKYFLLGDRNKFIEFGIKFYQYLKKENLLSANYELRICFFLMISYYDLSYFLGFFTPFPYKQILKTLFI